MSGESPAAPAAPESTSPRTGVCRFCANPIVRRSHMTAYGEVEAYLFEDPHAVSADWGRCRVRPLGGAHEPRVTAGGGS